MMQYIWKQYNKYREAINYLIFGFLTFVVNTVIYRLTASAIGARNDRPDLTLIANLIAWIIAVLFAYWTNRTFVFQSKVTGKKGRIKEFLGFLGARVATGVLDQVMMIVMTYYLNIDDLIAKIVCNIFVIVANYFFSKFIIFRKVDQ
ncbi:MAG: GtrA family protein [Lachnospiraceae bacterium]|jgi:putative flippase GtrA|nr:GtrA family protein [Lachnospiraceae bacterium]